jgi:tRNA A-37 threonylcarbamoyl transferase component Bud32
VIKNADSEEDINRLAYESTVNLVLRNAGVTAIPKVIGFFVYTSMPGQGDFPQPNAALVMEDAGQPLDGDVVSRDHMYVSNLHRRICHIDDQLASRTAFGRALQTIHNAGYRHRNLTRRNLVLSQVNDRPAIVALGDAQPTTTEQEKDDELERLMSLLPNPLKHTGDGNHTLAFLEVYPNTAFSTSGNDRDPSPDERRPKKGRCSAICASDPA